MVRVLCHPSASTRMPLLVRIWTTLPSIAKGKEGVFWAPVPLNIS